VASDRLTFRQQYIKQPPGYDNGNPMALKLSGEQLVVGDETNAPLVRAGDGRVKRPIQSDDSVVSASV
jgi:hypothetical protein